MADEFCKCQNSLVGVGGVKCPCCNMFFGRKRKKLNRLARRKLKIKDKKDIEKELTPDTE